ncbi:glutamyl-tRNA reductase [Ideonella sp. DXS29W]|uniref:Glutamyl-tRNA reductase n=1 Tax=Ideonella lacteola TaxID=2984193 RepID=A0ABU9BRJ1_9BURK
MALIAVGLNHGTAPIDLRGRFAIPFEGLAGSVQNLRLHLARSEPEAAILSTCNRTELYVAAANDDTLKGEALAWLAGRAGMTAGQLAGHTYAMTGAEAARHAFRVASGLDSQMLGEPMILGQMKQAMRAAESAGGLGSTLHQLFQRTFEVAKQVRSRTDVGAQSVSLAAAALRTALQLFEDIGRTRVLCVGAGEMIERAATHFAARRPEALVFANRTPARGAALAAKLGGTAIPLADLPQRLHEFDIVISCTASALPLIGLGAVERALKARRRRPMLLLDLAVPRDVEPEVARLPDAYLRTLDDLTVQVEGAGARRRAAVAQAESLIDEGVRRFGRWMDERGSVPLIVTLQGQAADWRALELARARRRLARGETVDNVLEALARALTSKMLHGPMAALHASAGEPEVADHVTRLFLRGRP